MDIQYIKYNYSQSLVGIYDYIHWYIRLNTKYKSKRNGRRNLTLYPFGGIGIIWYKNSKCAKQWTLCPGVLHICHLIQRRTYIHSHIVDCMRVYIVWVQSCRLFAAPWGFKLDRGTMPKKHFGHILPVYLWNSRKMKILKDHHLLQLWITYYLISWYHNVKAYHIMGM